MLEEESVENLIMEKKTPSSRSSSAQPPGKPASEGKRQESSNNKPKYNRRREQTIASSSKNPSNNIINNCGGGDGFRKISKSGNCKFADKRPRPRSQYYGCGKQNSKVADDGPEFGSVFNPGSKKQNLNHLLNFTLTPRVVNVHRSTTSHYNSSNYHWLLKTTTHKHKYNKEQFLQANCQFIVRAGEDYRKHLTDPDTLVDWPLIEQIRLRTADALSCPICLDEPKAAKMTRCGHVFCWPCILHYLALSDKTWRKCPICFEAVHRGDLKSVITITQPSYQINEEITLKLMKRERNSLVLLPVIDKPDSNDSILSINDLHTLTAFSKILTADFNDISTILNAEKLELECGLKEVLDEPEVCFFEQALDLLREREANLKLGDLNCSKHVEEASENSDGADEKIKDAHDDDDDEEEEDSDMPNVSPEDVEIESQMTGHKPFYFYQASDGQNIYLTALNLRMLEAQFSDLAHAPPVLTATIVERESGSMTRELRSRLRSLSHLPLTATFDLLEIDLSTIVSPDVYVAFDAQLKDRAERRMKRARFERKRDLQISRELNYQWSEQKQKPKIRLDSTKHFPRCGAESPTLEEQYFVNDTNSQCSVASGESDNIPLSTSPSFAQMLKATNSGRSSRGWENVRQSANNLIDDNDEYFASPPEYQHTLSEAINEAFDRINLQQDESGSKKKKKKKPKVLFATGLNFAAK